MSRYTNDRLLMKGALVELKRTRARLQELEKVRDEPIAIIGHGCRFPGGADNPEAFWDLLRNRVDAVTEIPRERWDVDAFYDPDPDTPGKTYVRHGSFLENIDLFDTDFFGISPREAERLDPQQRLLLEVSWEALEHAGLAPDGLSGTETGVYLGLMNYDYIHGYVKDLAPSSAEPYMLTGNSISFPAGRLSYSLGLHGPSMVVAAACSSSLVSIHLACQALRNRECDLALAGGVNLILDPIPGVMLSRMRALARDGRCKTFDAAADGYGRGEGCAIIVLKRLSDALQAKDRILALIRGSAINHDGPGAGLTVPSGIAQERLLRKALEATRIDPEAVSYVETHGTGTALGDPIEIKALAAAMGGRRATPLLVGSVKTNIGHLEAAAGVAGLMKTVLALQHEEIPAHLHLKKPNPHIPWQRIPLEITTRPVPWLRGAKPRIAGVSAFGLSGINAHLILEEAPVPETQNLVVDRPLHILTLSAKSATALESLADRYRAIPPEFPAADVFFTANTGRSHFPHRLQVIAASLEQIPDLLQQAERGRAGEPPGLAFLFTGQGSQYVDMGRRLFETQPTFRRALENCADILKSRLDAPLLDILYPDSHDTQACEQAGGLLEQTAYAQPALFALEYALGELLKSWGVEPSVVMGHSVGEYAAAFIAGVFSLEDGLKLVAERGRLMQALPRNGAMLAVHASEEFMRAVMAELRIEISIAAVNGPEDLVISGEQEAVSRMAVVLAERRINTRVLRVSHAFHSSLMEPVLHSFRRIAREIRFRQPRLRIISNMTGASIRNEIADPEYWTQHIIEPVRFSSGMQHLRERGVGVFIEIGPSPVLLGLGRRCLPDAYGAWLPCLRSGKDWETLLKTLGRLYMLGVPIDWKGFDRDYASSRKRVDLPTYPFQRRRFWALNHKGRSPTVGVSSREQDHSTAAPDSPRLRDQLDKASSAERPALITRALERRIIMVMGLSAAPSHERSLLELGLDSLMAMELIRWCRRDLDLEVDPAFFLSGPGINTLVRQLVARLENGQTVMSEPLPGNDPQSGGNGTADARDERVYGLSHGQQALWYIYHSAPKNSAYNVGLAFRIRSPLEVDVLKRVFQALTARHPALRTVFAGSGDEPVQKVLRESKSYFETIDAVEWSEEELAARVDIAQKRPFDLGVGPLMRVTLFHRADDNHILLLSFHHIICDNRSIWTLLGELRELYPAFKAGKPVSLPPPRRTYEDYIRREARMPRTETGERLWSYWRRQLAGEIPSLNIKTDFPRPPTETYRGAVHHLDLEPELTDQLRKFARNEQVTLFMLLLAAYQVLLFRYTGQGDICVGAPTAGQNESRYAGVMGYFLNTIVLRANLSADPTFRSLLKQTRETALEALNHKDYPYSLLVERLQPRREAGRAPLAQTRFSLQKPPPLMSEKIDRDGCVEWGGLRIEAFPLNEEEGQVDLNVQVVEYHRTLRIHFKYNTDLFRADTIERMTHHYRNLLIGILADPEQAVSVLPLMSESERRRVLYEWNDTDEGERPEICVHEWFEEQAAKHPRAIAVIHGKQSWTYAELNRRANLLAHHLRELGVGPEILVGIRIERSLELVAAILGVLKSGGAYVPIDPATPPERSAFILSDAGVAVVLTRHDPAGDFPEAASVCLNRDWPRIESGPAHNPEIEVLSSHPVYVIYTSGSTGRPKGVVIEHRALNNYLAWVIQNFRVGEGSGSPAFTSIGFDLTITSFFPPLMVGRTVQILPERDEIENLATLLQREPDFSLIKLTPTHLEMLSGLLPAKQLRAAVRNLVIGGEVLHGRDLTFWKKYGPEISLVNHYGPTEATVGCCVYPIRGPMEGKVPIGRPISNVKLYILDRRLQPVPAGVPGELHIGGAGLARGYLNRPGLTREKFITNPFGPGRLYKTGDLARYLADGNIEFLGRMDGQVKIRGHRIEPDEIACQLRNHPLIDNCVVLAREDRSGEKKLAAYFIPVRKSDIPTDVELRRYLADKLPPYMLPEHYVRLSSIPLIANGKVDAHALPSPEFSPRRDNFPGPRDAMELQLAPLWEDTLNIRPIGMRDAFFEMGGHSLLAVRLMARIQKHFGTNLPLSALVQHDTVEKMAALLRQSNGVSLYSPIVALRPTGTNPPLFCVPGAGGNVVYFQYLARRLGPEQPIFGLQAAGLDGNSQPHTRVEEMATYYIDAMLTVQPAGPYFLAGHSLGGWVVFEIAQQLKRRGHAVGLLAVIDTPTPRVTAERPDLSDRDQAHWIIELADRIRHLRSAKLEPSPETLRALGPEEQLHYFKDCLIRADLFPVGVGVDQLRTVLDLFRAHSQVRYSPRDAVPIPITLFRTETIPPNFSGDDVAWGWGDFGPVQVEMISGEHLTILTEPYVKMLAERLSRRLAVIDEKEEDLS